MKAKVTIGLCVKNAAKMVKTAFDSISIQNYPHELMKVVIVVDGSDNTLSLALEFAQQTDIPTFVTSNKDHGLGAARQIVMDNAEGDYILWVDDDFVLAKDYVKNQIEFMGRKPNVGAAKGFYEFSTPLENSIINKIVNLGVLAPSQPLNQIMTGGTIFRLKALEKISGFDVQIKGAGEDLDVSRRIRQSEWLLAANNSAKFYEKYYPTTLKALWKRDFTYGYGNHFLFHKYKDRQFLIQYFPPLALLVGFKMSSMIYRATTMKKAFAFSLIHFSSMIAGGLGFVRAHLDRYGHAKGHLG